MVRAQAVAIGVEQRRAGGPEQERHCVAAEAPVSTPARDSGRPSAEVPVLALTPAQALAVRTPRDSGKVPGLAPDEAGEGALPPARSLTLVAGADSAQAADRDSVRAQAQDSAPAEVEEWDPVVDLADTAIGDAAPAVRIQDLALAPAVRDPSLAPNRMPR